MIVFIPDPAGGYGSIAVALREAKALVELLEHAPFTERLLADMPGAVAGLCDAADHPATVVRYYELNGQLRLVAQAGAADGEEFAGVL